MRKKAFTLIELLVTIVLFSLLLGTALYSFRFISINMRNINNTNPQKAIHYDLLRGLFNSIYYYIDTNVEEVEIDKKFYLYFYGESKKCRFITKNPLFSREIALVELSYKDDNLWYKESPIFDKSKDYRHLERMEMEKKIPILKDIKELKFIYQFHNHNFSEIIKEIPQLVTIKFKHKSKEYQYHFAIKSLNLKDLIRLRFDRKEFN